MIKGKRKSSLGICYLTEKDAKAVAKQLNAAAAGGERHEKSFWEVTLEDENKYTVCKAMDDSASSLRKSTRMNNFVNSINHPRT